MIRDWRDFVLEHGIGEVVDKLMVQKKANEKCESRDEHGEEVTGAGNEEDRQKQTNGT